MIQLNKEKITGMVNYYENGILMQGISLENEEWVVRTEVVNTWILEVVPEVTEEQI